MDRSFDFSRTSKQGASADGTQTPRKSVGKMIRNRLIGLAAVLSAAVVAYDSPFTVDQTQQAVITQFGNPTRVIINLRDMENNTNTVAELKAKYAQLGLSVSEGAGLYFKIPIFQRVNRFDNRLLRWNGFPEQIPTADNKYIWIDTTARFSIEDPLKFLKAVGTESQAHGRLDDIVDSNIRNAITSRNLIESVRTDNRPMKMEAGLEATTKIENVTGGREAIVKSIRDESTPVCSDKYGIAIPQDAVLIKGISYVDSVKVDVESRMTAERMAIAMKYTSEGEGEAKKIKGEMGKQVNTLLSAAYETAKGIEGEADADATKIYAESFGRDPEFYSFWRQLQLYEAGLDKNTRVVFSLNSPLLKYAPTNIEAYKKSGK